MATLTTSFASNEQMAAALSAASGHLGLTDAAILARAAFDYANYYPRASMVRVAADLTRITLTNGDIVTLHTNGASTYPLVVDRYEYQFATGASVTLFGNVTYSAVGVQPTGTVTRVEVSHPAGGRAVLVGVDDVAVAGSSAVSSFTWEYQGTTGLVAGDMAVNVYAGADNLYHADTSGSLSSFELSTLNGPYTYKLSDFNQPLTSLNVPLDSFMSTVMAGGDTLIGSAGAQTLKGYDGNDVLDGGAGIDTMIGGNGSDTYHVRDVGDLVIETNSNASIGGVDTVYSYLANYILTANVENGRVMAEGAANLTGNGLGNVLYAGNGDNVLNGGGGTDTASYIYANAGVTVSLATVAARATGGSGNDTLIAIENLTGSNYKDVLTGNAGNNVLDGRAGADTMIGGNGSDTYYVRDVGDVVVETNASSAVGGVDTVYSYLGNYALGANIENGRVMATGVANLAGNELNNVLYAGSGNNVLDGGAGTDTVSYAYATKGVNVSLEVSGAQATGGSGSDTLVSVENLTGSAYADVLTGNAANNALDGGAGADTMTGGDGSDTYYVRDAGDIVVESNAVASVGGTDTVNSYLAAYTLTDNVEYGRIMAEGLANLSGNGLNNVLYAGAGDNVLDGGAGVDRLSYYYATAGVKVSLGIAGPQATGGSGSDTLLGIENLTGSGYNDVLTGNASSNVLQGGGGNDVFRFDTALNGTTNVDRISDFTVNEDVVELAKSIFGSLAGQTALAPDMLRAGAGVTTAADANDFLIYNSSNGALYYDADGSGAMAAVRFATLPADLALTTSSFMVV